MSKYLVPNPAAKSSRYLSQQNDGRNNWFLSRCSLLNPRPAAGVFLLACVGQRDVDACVDYSYASPALLGNEFATTLV